MPCITVLHGCCISVSQHTGQHLSQDVSGVGVEGRLWATDITKRTVTTGCADVVCVSDVPGMWGDV